MPVVVPVKKCSVDTLPIVIPVFVFLPFFLLR